MLQGRPTYTYNRLALQQYTVAPSSRSRQGRATIRFHFAYDGGAPGSGGLATIFVNDRKVAEGRIGQTQAVMFSADEGADVGMKGGTPVTDAYAVPFRFTGQIAHVTIDVNPLKARDTEQDAAVRDMGLTRKGMSD